MCSFFILAGTSKFYGIKLYEKFLITIINFFDIHFKSDFTELYRYYIR